MIAWFKETIEKLKAFWTNNWKRMFKEFTIFYSLYLIFTALISAAFGTDFWNTSLVLANIWFLVLIVRG